MSYFWGSRSSSLADTLAPHALQPAAAELLSGLEHPERSVRAAALGAELAKLSAALEKRGLVR